MQELNVRSLWDAPSLTFYKTARNADGMWPVSHSCQLLQDPCMGVWPPLQRFGGRYLNLLGCLAWSLSSRGCVSHFCPVLDWICGGLGFSAFHAPGRKGPSTGVTKTTGPHRPARVPEPRGCVPMTPESRKACLGEPSTDPQGPGAAPLPPHCWVLTCWPSSSAAQYTNSYLTIRSCGGSSHESWILAS